jgi:hypothetical protein
MRVSQRAIDAATYTGENNARCVLWDDSIPGFGCRIYPSGKKAFVLSYREANRKRLVTLGRVGVLPLPAAREKARARLNTIQDQKVNARETDQARDRRGDL